MKVELRGEDPSAARAADSAPGPAEQLSAHRSVLAHQVQHRVLRSLVHHCGWVAVDGVHRQDFHFVADAGCAVRPGG